MRKQKAPLNNPNVKILSSPGNNVKQSDVCSGPENSFPNVTISTIATNGTDDHDNDGDCDMDATTSTSRADVIHQ